MRGIVFWLFGAGAGAVSFLLYCCVHVAARADRRLRELFRDEKPD